MTTSPSDPKTLAPAPARATAAAATSRRDFGRRLGGALVAVLGAGAGAAMGSRAGPASLDGMASEGCADPAAAFRAARARADAPSWLAGYETLESDLAPLAVPLHGALPRELAGCLFRNGPARHELGGLRYRHLFDGDGAVQRYDLAPAAGGRAATLTHRARFVRTPKFEADSAAGRFVRQAFATRPPQAEAVRSADALNVANTSVVWHGGRLLALWEGGSATEIDPATLATRGFVRFSDELAGMPFSAHPRVEPDGTLWNFGISSLASLLTLYRLNPDGTLAHSRSLQLPDAAMVHDFAVTERHLVFLLPPFVFDAQRLRAGATFFDAYVWREDLGLRALVLDKAGAAAPRWFELPPGFVFHLGSACEEGGVIRLDAMRSPGTQRVRAGLLDTMCGREDVHAPTQPMLVELDLAGGRARHTMLPLAAEFPRIDPRCTGRHYSQVFMCTRALHSRWPVYDAVARLDVKRGHIDRWHYGPGIAAEEHVFVPRAAAGAGAGAGAGEGAGWLVGSALDTVHRRLLFSVFDAQHLAAGPLAQAVLPRTVPLGLHAQFVRAG